MWVLVVKSSKRLQLLIEQTFSFLHPQPRGVYGVDYETFRILNPWRSSWLRKLGAGRCGTYEVREIASRWIVGIPAYTSFITV